MSVLACAEVTPLIAQDGLNQILAPSCCRVIRAARENPEALLALLDECLGAVAGAGAPAQLVSPSAFALLRDISQLLAHSYLDVTGGAFKEPGTLYAVLMHSRQ